MKMEAQNMNGQDIVSWHLTKTIKYTISQSCLHIYSNFSKLNSISVIGITSPRTRNTSTQDNYILNIKPIKKSTANVAVVMMRQNISSHVIHCFNSYHNSLASTNAEISYQVSTHPWHRELSLLGVPNPQSLEESVSIDQCEWAAHRVCSDSVDDAETTSSGTTCQRDEDRPAGLVPSTRQQITIDQCQ